MTSAEEDLEAVAKLVDAVGGHARSLVLLGELVAEKGVSAVAEDVRGMMHELEKRYPEERERSVIASVKLSLRRLPEGVRRKIRALAVFQGAAHVGVVARVLQVESEEALDLCRQLVAVGLAGKDGRYLLPDPALGAVLAGELAQEEMVAAEARWLEATVRLVGFLYRQRHQDAKIALHGTRVALAEFLAALVKLEAEVGEDRGDAEKTMIYVTNLEALVSSLGVPRVLECVTRVRQGLSKRLPKWSHARFNAESEEVDRRHERGDRQGALDAARALRDQVEAAGDAFPEAAYDRARGWWRLGRMLHEAGHAQEALDVLDVAQRRFAALAEQGDRSAARMASATITERAEALKSLGRLDEAATAYEEGVTRAKRLGDLRGVAAGSGQLGALRSKQGRFDEALAIYKEAWATFEALGEPEAVATIWHQIGILHAGAERFETAEHAYKESLRLKAACTNLLGEAATLHELASLYDDQGRQQDAAVLYRQAAEIYRALKNKVHEGSARNNLGAVLGKLRRFDEAHDALTAALALKEPHGHAGQSWKPWAALEDVESEAGRPEAALEARRQALHTYRAYRLDGGEPMDWPTRLIAAFGRTLRTSGPEAARALLPDLAQVPAQFAPALRALHALATDSRDPALADNPTLYSTLAVELALLLESLRPAEVLPPNGLVAP